MRGMANLLCHGLRREAQRHAALARSHRINPPQCDAFRKRRRRFALPAHSKMTGSPTDASPTFNRAGNPISVKILLPTRATRFYASSMAFIGQRNLLPVVRESGSGLHLDGGELGEILLPGRYIPRDRAPQDKLDVFIYRDSEDRLVATTEKPFAMVGEFAYLRVVSINRQIGAFLDWGLPKDLLLPFREQTNPVRVGQRVVVCVCLDPKTDRIMASARLNRHLSEDTPAYRDGAPVTFLITGRTALGYTAIVQNAHRGLLYHDNLSASLEVGQVVKGFVRTVRPGGKIDLSLDASGYQRVSGLAGRIVEALERNGGELHFDDDSSPIAIREAFGVSKSAFKQALGKLYKQRRIQFEKPGIRLLENENWSPGK